MTVCMLSCFYCVQLFTIQWTVACQALLSIGFSRQAFWSGLPFHSPGDLPYPGTGAPSLTPTAWASARRRSKSEVLVTVKTGIGSLKR